MIAEIVMGVIKLLKEALIDGDEDALDRLLATLPDELRTRAVERRQDLLDEIKYGPKR